MSVEIHIIDGPIGHGTTAGATASSGPAEHGAELTFDGVVRAMENGRRIAALLYDVYEPMASRELRSLAEDVVRTHTLLELRCLHSRGEVPVGQCSMRVTIRSTHRAEALAAMGEFIARLKRDVPIWKRPVWAND